MACVPDTCALQVLLAGITGAVAGAISMSMSEFIGIRESPILHLIRPFVSSEVQPRRAKQMLLLAIWPLRRLTSSNTAKWSWRKYELARTRHLSEAHATLQVREVFQELGMQGDTLEKACAHVGASDETLMSFMKVGAIAVVGWHHLMQCASGFRVRLQ
jgi:hypothetical protein